MECGLHTLINNESVLDLEDWHRPLFINAEYIYVKIYLIPL